MVWLRQLGIAGIKHSRFLNIPLTISPYNIHLFSSLSPNCIQARLRGLPLMNTETGYNVHKNTISTSSILMSAPSKKKRRSDPMIERKRDEKRAKKFTRALKKLEKKQRIPKPLLELEVDPNIFGGEMKIKRDRALPNLSAEQNEEKIETHAILKKAWNRYAGKRHVKEIRLVDSVLIRRQHALEELRKESNELYAEAIKPEVGILDNNLRIFYKAIGPNSSPPIRKEFDGNTNDDWLVDGHYKEVSKSFSIQYGGESGMKSFLTGLLHRKPKKKASERNTEEED